MAVMRSLLRKGGVRSVFYCDAADRGVFRGRIDDRVLISGSFLSWKYTVYFIDLIPIQEAAVARCCVPDHSTRYAVAAIEAGVG